MQKGWIAALIRNRGKIRLKWETLLRIEEADSPISDPEYLVHLIDWTLDEIFAQLRNQKPSHPNDRSPFTLAELQPNCRCGHNPLLKLFIAGEQALLEALILLQAEAPHYDPLHRSTAVTELYLAINIVAKREVGTLCSMCKRPSGPVHSDSEKAPCPPRERSAGLPLAGLTRSWAGRRRIPPATRRNTRLNCERDWKPASKAASLTRLCGFSMRFFTFSIRTRAR